MARPGGVGGWRLRAMGPRRVRAFTGSNDVLPALGNLIAQYDMQQGADPDVVYDLKGNYNAIRGLYSDPTQPAWKPSWHAKGLKWTDNLNQMISFPAALQEAAVTDLICFTNPLPPLSGTSVQGRTMHAPGGGFTTVWYYDGKIAKIQSSLFTDNFSPADSMIGDVCFTATYGTGGKLYWNDTEAAAYLRATDKSLPTGTSGYRLFGYPFLANNFIFYYRLCWNAQLIPTHVAQAHGWVSRRMAARSVTLGETRGNWPQIIGFGDSITAGGNSSSDMLTTLRQSFLTDNIYYANCGLGGDKLDDISAKITEVGPSLFAKTTATPKIAIVMGGTNNLFFDAATTPAQLVAKLATCVTNARSAGATKVIAITPPRGAWNFTNDDTLRYQPYCELIKSGGSGADYVCDITADSHIGYAANLSDSAYYNDYAHVTQAAYTIFATALEPLLLSCGVT